MRTQLMALIQDLDELQEELSAKEKKAKSASESKKKAAVQSPLAVFDVVKKQSPAKKRKRSHMLPPPLLSPMLQPNQLEDEEESSSDRSIVLTPTQVAEVIAESAKMATTVDPSSDAGNNNVYEIESILDMRKVKVWTKNYSYYRNLEKRFEVYRSVRRIL